MVALEPAQRLRELPHRDSSIAPVRADLRHQEDVIPPVDERFSHALFALPLVVFPSVVHERDAGVDRGVHDADRFALRSNQPQMIPAQPERADSLGRPAERALGNLATGCARSGCAPSLLRRHRRGP